MPGRLARTAARRILAAVIGAMAGGGFTVSLVVASTAAPAGASTPPGPRLAADCSTGVVVAVDLEPWRGVIDTVCLSFLPATAVAALQDTGFAPTPVAPYGLAFVCQIAGDPPGADCSTTPPANAYWSFWYADAGQGASWTYSSVGAMGLEPQAGSIEAWVFGGQTGDSQPAIPSPDELRAATTDVVSVPAGGQSGAGPAPAASSAAPGAAPSGPPNASGAGGAAGSAAVPAAGGPAPGPPATAAGTGAPGGAAGSRSPTGGAPAPAASGSTSSSSPTRPESGRRPPPRVVSTAPVLATGRRAAGSVGSVWSVVAGAVLVGVLVVTAALVARRRRRTG